MSEPIYRWATDEEERTNRHTSPESWVRLYDDLGEFGGLLVPVEVDQGFISRAIITELDRRCMGDVPPGQREWARDHFENVLTDDEGLPRMMIYEISDAVVAALGIGGDDEG